MDEIIDNMAQGRKALGLIYSGDATYVMAEKKTWVTIYGKLEQILWSDAMVIPKNAKNPELAYAFINYASDYDGAYDNSSYIGYTSANKEVMDDLSGSGRRFRRNQCVHSKKQTIKMMKYLNIMKIQRRLSVICGAE